MYDDDKWHVGSLWWDLELKCEVELVYCRNVTDFRRVDTREIYSVFYHEMGKRFARLRKPTTFEVVM